MSLYDDASLIMYPSGVKASKIYCQKPTDGSGDLTFARAGTKTYIDANGARQTAAANVMPVSYEGGGCGKFNFEPQRTNLLLNSDTLSTQNITTTAQSYVLSFEGTGTVTLSGTYAGSLVGTGATPADRVNLVFTATAGTLTVTVSGSVLNAQIEAGSYPTSYIPTAGSTVTRVEDSATAQLVSSGVWDGESGTIFIDIEDSAPFLGYGSISSLDRFFGGTSGYLGILSTATDNLIYANTGGFLPFGSTSANKFKFAITFNSTTAVLFINGVKVSTNSKDIRLAIREIYLSQARGQMYKYGNIQLYQDILSDAQLIELTT